MKQEMQNLPKFVMLLVERIDAWVPHAVQASAGAPECVCLPAGTIWKLFMYNTLRLQ